MLDGFPVFSSWAVPDAPIGIERLARRDGIVRMTRLPREIAADAGPLAVTPSIVRLAAAGAIAANGLVPFLELWRIALVGDSVAVRDGALATAALVALHLWHVMFGLRGEQPRAGSWTLAVLAIVNVAAAVYVGRIWAMQLASLAVSVLIVVHGPAAPTLVPAIALSPLVFGQTTLPTWADRLDPIAAFPAPYLVLAVAWRTVTMFVPVRLVAMIQQLEAARRSLESRAVIQTRSRIEEDLHSGLERALLRIIGGGEVVRRATAGDPVRASAELQALVMGSRRALTDARRIAAGYRTASLRAELDAATSLLQAAGSTCR